MSKYMSHKFFLCTISLTKYKKIYIVLFILCQIRGIIRLASAVATITLLGFLILTCLPYILDVIVPMNESRSRQLLINVEYFVDEEIYFYIILTHSVLTLYAGNITIVAIATILIAYVLHTCAMFKIAR